MQSSNVDQSSKFFGVEINPTFVFAMLLQFIIFVVWAAKLDQRMQSLEETVQGRDIVERIRAVEVRMDGIQDSLVNINNKMEKDEK